MKEIKTFKMTYESKLFKKGQRVFIVYSTGAQAALCCGKYRNKGRRWLHAWVKWDSKNKPFPKIERFEITDNFYNIITQR